MTAMIFCDDFVIVVLTARFAVSFRKYRAAASKPQLMLHCKKYAVLGLLCWQPLTVQNSPHGGWQLMAMAL